MYVAQRAARYSFCDVHHFEKGAAMKHIVRERGIEQRNAYSGTRFCNVLLMLALFTTLDAQAGCPSYDEALNYVQAYWDRRPAAVFSGLSTLGEAYCAQGIVAAEIGRRMGTPAGYRVALSGGDAQQRYRLPHPVRGFLFKHMFLNSGASIPADFSAVPVVSADLIAVVKGEDFQRAKSPLELLEHIDYLLPFIQLSEPSPGDSQSALTLIATNLGTRFGVVGSPIPVEHSQAFYEKLAVMRVVMTDGEGNELGAGYGSESIEHPLHTLHWLGRDLEYNAQRIQPGDRLSVGAFFAPIPARAGQEISVRYVGLPGEPLVSIRIAEPVGGLLDVAERHECFTNPALCNH
jgi:2-keto-4-pentenoate hydratase